LIFIRLRRRPRALPVDAVGHSLWRRTMSAYPVPRLAWVEIRCFGGFRHRRITLRPGRRTSSLAGESLGNTHRSALATRGVGGYFNGGITGFARGAPLGTYSKWSISPLAINLRPNPLFEPASPGFTGEMLSTPCTNVPFAVVLEIQISRLK
jgi:hypothetical protein